MLTTKSFKCITPRPSRMFCRQRNCATTKSFRCNTYKKWGGGLNGALRSPHLISWQRTSEGRYEPDRNQEVSALPSDDVKFAKILRSTAARSPHRIASGKFRYCRREIPRLERNLRGRPPYTHRKLSMLARFQWRRVGFKLEPDKRNGKRRRLAFRAGDFHRRAAGLQIRRRKHHE